MSAVAPAAERLSDRIYATLKAELQDFRLIPGDRLSEAELGLRLGASRTPVREALLRLRKEGLLDVDPRSGWHVRPLDFDKLEELYDLRVLIECACVARLCARESATLPALEALKAVWLVPAAERLGSPGGPGDAHRLGELDEAFHAELVRAAGNGEIARVHAELTDRIRVIRRLDFTRPERVQATYDEHAKVLRAIVQRKADVAQLLVRSHIEQSKAEVRRITLQTLFDARRRPAPVR